MREKEREMVGTERIKETWSDSEREIEKREIEIDKQTQRVRIEGKEYI